MAIGKDKVGVLVNMDKELKAKLESIAKDDGRSLTNLINKILADYVEDTHKQVSFISYDLVHSKKYIAEIDRHIYQMPIQAFHHYILY